MKRKFVKISKNDRMLVESSISRELAEQYKAKPTKCKNGVGIIDLANDEMIMEIKTGMNWKNAIGQIIAYGSSPENKDKKKFIYLFNHMYMKEELKKEIENICESLKIILLWKKEEKIKNEEESIFINKKYDPKTKTELSKIYNIDESKIDDNFVNIYGGHKIITFKILSKDENILNEYSEQIKHSTSFLLQITKKNSIDECIDLIICRDELNKNINLLIETDKNDCFKIFFKKFIRLSSECTLKNKISTLNSIIDIYLGLKIITNEREKCKISQQFKIIYDNCFKIKDGKITINY